MERYRRCGDIAPAEAAADEGVARAKAAIWLACEEAGPHMAVVLLNDALREQLDGC
jgi:hypothetical protein